MIFSNIVALALLVFMASIAVILAFLTSSVSENLSYIASVQEKLLKRLSKKMDNEDDKNE